MMRTNHYRLIILAVLLGAGVTACTVKDERGGMPSYLSIFFREGKEGSPALTEVYALNTLSTGYDTFRFGKDLIPDERPDGLLLCVPRGYTTVGAYSGLKAGAVDGEVLSWPSGTECDSLWAHTSVADCRRELARDTVRLHKQWCTLGVVAVNQSGDEGYSFRVEALSAGLDVLRIAPVETGWKYTAPLRTPEGNRFEVRIPRQSPEEAAGIRLFLSLPSGEEVENYPLGEVMARAGYDWTEKDLADIDLKIDFIRLELTAIVVDWTDGGQIEITF